MTVRVGVIGVRFGARVHIPALQSEGVEVVAVCARHEERAKAAAEEFGIPHVFTDYSRMVKMDGLDAVIVVSPPYLHHPMGMAAMGAGKHVICEKPFTASVKDAHDLWRKASTSGLTAMIAHEFRFSSGRAYVAELVREGYIGRLHTCLMTLFSGSRLNRAGSPLTDDDDAEIGGGVLWSQGSHYVDCVRHWFGDVKSVYGRTAVNVGERTDPKTGVAVQATADDAFQATLELANGGWASLTFDNAAPFGPGGNIEVYGREGTLVTPQEPGTPNPPAHGVVMGAKVGESALRRLEVPERLQPFEDTRDMRLMPMRLLVREFLRGIEQGVSPSPNFYDAFRVQQVLQAIRDSSASGRAVAIEVGE